jgi:hypothetical protein
MVLYLYFVNLEVFYKAAVITLVEINFERRKNDSNAKGLYVSYGMYFLVLTQTSSGHSHVRDCSKTPPVSLYTGSDQQAFVGPTKLSEKYKRRIVYVQV